MFLHFNDAARLAMRLAEGEARQARFECIDTHHLLLALVQLHDCVAARVLKKGNIELERVRHELAGMVVAGVGEAGGRLPLTPGVRKAIDCATAAADRLGDGRVGTGHLFARATGQQFRNGFFDQTAQLWSRAGVLLATSSQIVYFKE